MLKNGDRVDIKMLAWPCRNFSPGSAAGVQETFRKMNGTMQKTSANRP
jgi:hypothetical protein